MDLGRSGISDAAGGRVRLGTRGSRGSEFGTVIETSPAIVMERKKAERSREEMEMVEGAHHQRISTRAASTSFGLDPVRGTNGSELGLKRRCGRRARRDRYRQRWWRRRQRFVLCCVQNGESVSVSRSQLM